MFIWSHKTKSHKLVNPLFRCLQACCLSIGPPIFLLIRWIAERHANQSHCHDALHKHVHKPTIMHELTGKHLWWTWLVDMMSHEDWRLRTANLTIRTCVHQARLKPAPLKAQKAATMTLSAIHLLGRPNKKSRINQPLCLCRSGEKPHDENGVNLESQWDSVRRICSPVSNKSCCCRYGSAIQIQKLACARVTGPKARITPFNKHVLAHSILFTEVFSFKTIDVCIFYSHVSRRSISLIASV